VVKDLLKDAWPLRELRACHAPLRFLIDAISLFSFGQELDKTLFSPANYF
jgi:hypothetical protein